VCVVCVYVPCVYVCVFVYMCVCARVYAVCVRVCICVCMWVWFCVCVCRVLLKHSVHIYNVDALLFTMMSLLRHNITLMQQLLFEMTHFGSFSVIPTSCMTLNVRLTIYTTTFPRECTTLRVHISTFI